MAFGSDKRATLETAGKSRIQSRLKPTGITHRQIHEKRWSAWAPRSGQLERVGGVNVYVTCNEMETDG